MASMRPGRRSQTGSWRSWLGAVLVSVAGFAVAVFLIVAKPSPTPEAPPTPAPPLVRFVPAAPALQAISVTTQGTVQPEIDLSLTAQVSGRVESLGAHFLAGGFFEPGEVLVQLERADYELALARAESQVAGAEQTLAEEEGRALQARREWRELGSRAANSLFLREPQLAAAKAAVKAARAELETARLNLTRTSVSLPFAGRVVQKSADLGQFITAGTPLARVYGTELARVRLPITDRQLALLDLPLSPMDGSNTAPGPAVTLRATLAGQPQQWQARITRTEAIIDEQSRSLYAVATIANPFEPQGGGRLPLLPGLFVEAEIAGRALADVAQLPRSALRSDGRVLLVDAENRLQDQNVTSVFSNGTHVWLRGLATGDRVVVDDDPVLFAGMDVAPQPAHQLAQEQLAP